MKKKKILISIGGYLPAKKFGGPVVSINNICSLLKNDFDFYIVTKNHDLNSKKKLEGITDGWNERDNSKVQYIDDSEINKVNLKKIIKEINPDLIYINSLFGRDLSEPLLKLSEKNKIPVLLASRGELCSNPLKSKRIKKMFYIRYFNSFFSTEKILFQATSDEEKENIERLIKNSKTVQLPNIPEIFELDVKTMRKFENNSLDNDPIKLIFYSRIHPKKNLLYALDTLEKVNSRVVFDIFGPIEDKKYWDTCCEKIDKISKKHNITYKGELSRDDIPKTLVNYDILFFPTLSENYGHVVIEAMSMGCKVLISDQTPWKELEKSHAGWEFSLEENEKFVSIIENKGYIKDRLISKEESRQYFEKIIDIKVLKQNYFELMTSLISGEYR